MSLDRIACDLEEMVEDEKFVAVMILLAVYAVQVVDSFQRGLSDTVQPVFDVGRHPKLMSIVMRVV